MTGLKTILRTRCSLLILLLVLAGCPPRKPVEPPVTRITSTHVVQKGETLEIILNAYVSKELSGSIIAALQDVDFPFRRCIPGDSLTIIKENKIIAHLTYWQSAVSEFYVVHDSGHFYISMKLPYIDTVACFLKGVVNSTLYESMLNGGETPTFVYRFADIFAWEIDFITETQNGDSFFVYCEKTYCDSVFIEYERIEVARYKGHIGDYHGIYFCDPDGNDDYYNLKGESLRKSLLKSPLKFSYISSYFSRKRYHPILKVWRPHHGLDYKAPVGTPISSIGNGTVVFKGWKGGYGNLVEIRHSNNYKSRYGHLSRFAKGLYKGKKVKMGELIGYVGSTGLSTGPHLHFELHKNGAPINPFKVKIPRAPSVKKKYQDEFERVRDSVLKFIETPPDTVNKALTYKDNQ